ncbi:MAG: hypothetical protein ACLT16_10540 [[Clostridium] innocuum]
MKKGIVIIGGGSSYTPELRGLYPPSKGAGIREIWLVDVEAGREAGNRRELAQRMWDASGYTVRVHRTMNGERL